MKYSDDNFYNATMPINGNPVSIYELATWKNGLAFRSIDFSETGLPVIKIAELNNGISNSTSYTNAQYSREVYLTKGDIVFSWSGNPDTSIDVYRYDLPDGWLNQHIFKVTPNKNIVDQEFLFYLLKFLKPRFKKIARNKQTTGLGHVTIADLKKLIITLPTIDVQKRIGSILKSFDDKITINNAINNNLQQQAMALFKEWFIDTLEASNWTKGTLYDIVESTISGDWGKDTPIGTTTQEVYCIRGADIPEIKMGNKGKMPIRYILPKNFSLKQLVAGDLVVEISGGSPTQSTGRIAIIPQALLDRYESGMVCTNFCKAIKPKVNYSMFLYQYWQYLYDKGVFFSYENGTTGIKNLDLTGVLSSEPLRIPPQNKIVKFNSLCNPIFSQIYANGKQNEELSILRDTLLPKLMSGEIDVSDVEI